MCGGMEKPVTWSKYKIFTLTESSLIKDEETL
jgi:hypothetical protein